VLLAVLCVFVGCPSDETQNPEETLTPAQTVLVDVGDLAPGFEREEFDEMIVVIEEAIAALETSNAEAA